MQRAVGCPEGRAGASDPGTGVTVKFPKLWNFYLALARGNVQLPGRMPGCARVLLAFTVRCRTLSPKERSEGWSAWPTMDRAIAR